MWHRIAVTPSSPHLAPAVSAQMFESGAEGVHEDGLLLITNLPPHHDPASFIAGLRVADPSLSATHGEVADVDWSTKWRDLLTSHRLGSLTVSPPWLSAGLDPASTVVIDPGMAFGTGDHPTTRGVIRLLQSVIRPGVRIADLGAGSAVLSIAAVKLGASSAFAIESDPDSIANAEENAARNGVADRIAVIEGDAFALLPVVAPVDIILANIVSSVLLELLPSIAASLASGGRAILSGILIEERVRMLGALQAGGWRVESEDSEDQWWSVCVSR